jgi:ribA/ribD-fused uncharacterized protein
MKKPHPNHESETESDDDDYLNLGTDLRFYDSSGFVVVKPPPTPQVHLFYNGPLSQWASCYMKIDGVMYNCAEQYMMVQKALYFKDLTSAKLIMEAESPAEQKRLGRLVKKFRAQEWAKVSRRFVYIANREKYKVPTFRTYLLATGDALIAEASPTDTIWGIGLAEDDPKAQDPNNWKGTNWLGEMLMQVRQEIRNGDY